MTISLDSPAVADRLREAARTIERLRDELDRTRRRRAEPLAVVGMALRMPGGAETPAAFWRMLEDGVDAVGPFPAERGDAAAMHHPDPDHPGTAYVTRGAFLDSIDGFDPAVFGISPREAVGMDPQQRIALELAWEALERAGYPPDSLVDSATGVFVGVSTTDYVRMRQELGDPDDVDHYQLLGEPSFVAGRISHVLGLQGPSQVIDTTCSSSLVALDAAARALRDRRCDLALAGGVNLMLSPYGFLLMSKFRALAPDGRCKTFDEAADGYVRGEGAGLVALKRLEDALAAGDDIRGIVLGSAVNHDGASSGMTVPNGASQERVLRAALADGGVDPASVDYVEAHGTGTSLGDPIELRALEAVYGACRARGRPAARRLGEDERRPPGAGGRDRRRGEGAARARARADPAAPAPRAGEHPDPVVVDARRGAGERSPLARARGPAARGGELVRRERDERPRGARGGAAAPASRALADGRAEAILVSARTPAALAALAGRYAGHLRTGAALADVAFTTQVGRARLGEGAVVVAADRDEAIERLDALAAGEPDAPRRIRRRASRHQRAAWLLPGQGAQTLGMAAGLRAIPAFERPLSEALEHLDDIDGRPLADIVWGGDDPAAVNDTGVAQPALFAVSYALGSMLLELGARRPAALLGHSVGELAAACLGGALDLPDAARLVSARGRLMSALPAGGAMVALGCTEEALRAAIEPGDVVAVAAVNGPRDVVASGAEADVQRVVARLEAQGVRAQPLRVSHAFHSPLIEPALDDLAAVVDSVTLRAPSIPIVSNVTGTWWDERSLTAGYWTSHAASAVRFGDGVALLANEGLRTFVELGAHPVLLPMARRVVEDDDVAWLATLRRGTDDLAALQEALGQLDLDGDRLDWRVLHAGRAVRRVELPTYPWERERYWFRERTSRRPDTPAIDGLGRRVPGAADVFEEELPVAPEATLSAVVERALRGARAAGIAWGRLGPAHAAAARGTRRRRAVDRADGGARGGRRSGRHPVGRDAAAARRRRPVDAARQRGAARAGQRRRRPRMGPARRRRGRGPAFIRVRHVRRSRRGDRLRGRPARGRAASTPLRPRSVRSRRPSGSRRPLARRRGIPCPTSCSSSTGKTRRGEGELPGSVRLCGGDDRVAEAVDAVLLERGAATVRTPAPPEPQDVQPGELVVLLAPADAPCGADLAYADLRPRGLDHELALCRLVAALDERGDGARVAVLTRGAAATPGQAVHAPLGATLHGLGRVLALEHPVAWGGVVDLDPCGEDDAATIVAALAALDPEDEQAVRGARRLAARVTGRGDRPLPAVPARLHRPGTVLVTGGLGAIGARLCRRLARAGTERLVLLARSPLPDESSSDLAADDPRRGRIDTVRAIRALGAQVEVEAVDVTDADAVRALVERLCADETLPLRGVVHAAGVSGPQFARDVTPEAYAGVWAPKVEGAWALHEATRDADLDLFVCFSSVAASWGSQHLASYAASNAFLDALAHQRRAEGLPAMTVAWGTWALDSALFGADVLEFMESIGLRQLAADQCLDLLLRLHASGATGAMVCAADWATYRPVMEARRPRPRLSRIHAAEADVAEGDEELLRSLAAAAPGDRAALLLATVRRAVGAVLELDPERVDADGDVFALGIDSLMVMEIVARLRAALAVELRPSELFERSSARAWAELLAERVGGDVAPEREARWEQPSELAADAVLAEDILPGPAVGAPAGALTDVVLTGATGFVGAFVLRDLLASGARRVRCLVRAESARSGWERIAANAATYLDLPPDAADRVEPVCGDLAQPQLGLESPEALVAGADAVLHAGAHVNFVHPYERVRDANVAGTEELLRICARAGVPLHHVSTYGIWGMPLDGRDVVREDDDIATAGRLVTGYVQSKWAAERLVRDAADRGVAVNCYRLGRVLGDATTGAALTSHFTLGVVKGCMQLGAAPALDLDVEMTPVDYVSAALVRLAATQPADGATFHLVSGRHMAFAELVEHLRARGWPLETLAPQDWFDRLEEALAGGEENVLHTVMDTVRELVVGGERAIVYDDARTQAALDGSGIACPPLDARLLDTYLDRLLADGFLPEPAGAGSGSAS